jgi:hypothetical protein
MTNSIGQKPLGLCNIFSSGMSKALLTLLMAMLGLPDRWGCVSQLLALVQPIW